jgi:hypothetical protein
LCRGFLVQITRTTPRRLITLQCSQIGLTLLRTFIPAAFIEFIVQLSNICALPPEIKTDVITGGHGQTKP